MEKSYQKFTKDVAIIGVTTLLLSLLGIVQLSLLTKTLGAHDYGIWIQFNVTVSLILPFTSLGLGGALIRFLAAEKNREAIQEQFYSVLSVLFMIQLVVALAIIVIASPLAMNFFDGAVQIVRITGILALLTSMSGTYLILIRAFQQIKTYSIFTITEECCRVGLIAYLVLTGHGIFSVVLAIIATKVFILLVLFFLIKSQIGIKRPHFSRIKEYLRFGLPLVPGSISFWLVRLSDRYVIGFFLGLTSVGVYSVASTLGFFSYALVGVLNLVMMQTLSKLYDEGRLNEVKTHLSYSLKYLLTITIPFAFGAAILAEPILRMLSTPEIASQGHLVTPIIALGTLFLNATTIVAYILILTKKPKMMGLTWIGAAVVNIGLNVLVVPRLGVIGAAITTLIVFTLALGSISYYSFKEFKFSIDWHFIMKSLIASSVMSVAVWLMAPRGNLDTLLAVVAGVVIYGVVIILLRGFSKEEISFFRGLFRRSTPAA